MIDATRIQDGAKVVLKRVRAMSDEVHIALHLSSPQMRSDPRNCAVAIIDVIPVPGEMEEVFLVMPFLRQFDSPPFHCRAEFVEALRQFLQVRTQELNNHPACKRTYLLSIGP